MIVDLKPLAQGAIAPLWLVFAGGLFCLIDTPVCLDADGGILTASLELASSQGIGEGYDGIDVFHDAIGSSMILVGLWRLAAIPCPGRYQDLMMVAKVAAGVALFMSIDEYLIDNNSMFFDIFGVVATLLKIIGILSFCLAMRALCRQCGLPRSASSWHATTEWFLWIYVVPLGMFNVAALASAAGGHSAIVGFGEDSTRILFFVFAVVPAVLPFVRFCISIGRMRSEAKGPDQPVQGAF